MVGGIVLAVAVICDCLVLGLWLQSLNSVVKLLGGMVQLVVGPCRPLGTSVTKEGRSE